MTYDVKKKMKKNWMLSHTRFKIVAVVSLLIALMFCMPNLTVTVKAADTFIVDDDGGTADYTSIQDAIDNCPENQVVFIPEGADRSFAEMSLAEKNLVSHRARAIRKLSDFLESKSDNNQGPK